MQREGPNAQLLPRRGVAPKSDLIGIDAERRKKMLRDSATGCLIRDEPPEGGLPWRAARAYPEDQLGQR